MGRVVAGGAVAPGADVGQEHDPPPALEIACAGGAVQPGDPVRGQPAAEPAVELRAGPRPDGHGEEGIERCEPGDGHDDVSPDGGRAGAVRQAARVGEPRRARQGRADPLEQGAHDEADDEREDAAREARAGGARGEEADPREQEDGRVDPPAGDDVDDDEVRFEGGHRPTLRRADVGPGGDCPRCAYGWSTRLATCRAAPQWRRSRPSGRAASRDRISPYSRSRCHGCMAMLAENVSSRPM